MPESFQHYLDRNRPPRVQITYDVEIGNAIEMKELPFVVGILADLSGTITAEEKANRLPVKERKFVEIDRDNFNEVMKSIQPKLELSVVDASKPKKDNGDPNTFPVTLRFNSIEDFDPLMLITRKKGKDSLQNDGLQTLKGLLDTRQALSDLLTKLDGNDRLDTLLTQALTDPESQKQLASQTALLPAADDSKTKTEKKADDAAKIADAKPADAKPTEKGDEK